MSTPLPPRHRPHGTLLARRIRRLAGRGVLVAVALVLATTLAAACRGTPDHDSVDVETPQNLKASLDGQGSSTVVSFRPVDGASAYEVNLGDDEDGIRVPGTVCGESNCSVSLDRLTVAAADTVTVSAVEGKQVSKESEPVDLPGPRPSQHTSSQSPKGRSVTLVVTRRSHGGKPVIKTEHVRSGKAEARMRALHRSKDVLGVGVDTPVRLSQARGGSQVPPRGGTWQQEALGFDLLPHSAGLGVKVAIVDAYVDTDHPSFDSADIVTTLLDPGVDEGERLTHATGVASMIVGGGSGPVTGIATKAKVHSYDAIDQGGVPSIKPVAEAVIQAVDDGADVINLSLSFKCELLSYRDLGCPEDTLGPAIDYAERKGVVVVAAAGNDGDTSCTHGEPVNQNQWPAKFPTVIAVGATERDGSVFECSAHKPYVDVVAPGVDLLVAKPPDGYGIASGTSYSAPLVAGLVADVLAERPHLTPDDVRSLLRVSRDENKRLVTAALLLTAGILPGDEPAVDPTTLRRIVPFSALVSFPDGSKVWDQAVATYAASRKRNFFWDKHTYDEFPVKLAGTLFVDQDGRVSGFGYMQPFARREIVGEGSYAAHFVDCPVASHASYAFAFETPMYVEGQVRPDKQTGRRSLDLTVSLGRGATAERSGRLGNAIEVKEHFDRCKAAYHKPGVRVWWTPEIPWKKVKAWPERNLAAFQSLYQTVLDSTPITIEDADFPRMEGVEGSDYLEDVGSGDRVSWRLHIGDANLENLCALESCL